MRGSSGGYCICQDHNVPYSACLIFLAGIQINEKSTMKNLEINSIAHIFAKSFLYNFNFQSTTTGINSVNQSKTSFSFGIFLRGVHRFGKSCHLWCYGLNVCSLSKSICWNLTLNAMIVGGAFGRWVVHEGGTLMHWTSVFI